MIFHHVSSGHIVVPSYQSALMHTCNEACSCSHFQLWSQQFAISAYCTKHGVLLTIFGLALVVFQLWHS